MKIDRIIVHNLLASAKAVRRGRQTAAYEEPSTQMEWDRLDQTIRNAENFLLSNPAPARKLPKKHLTRKRR